jgi:type IV fimbrial biogenesis protein FimT
MHARRYPRCTPKEMPVSCGFTLIELMVTISVMAVVLMIAAPSFSDAVLSMKLNSHANNLVAGIYAARSEAIKRNASVNLCASADGTTCANSGGWEQGWIVMCNTNDNTTCNTGGPNTIVIQRQPAADAGFSVIALATGTATVMRSITFQATGVGVPPTTLTLCRATPNVGHTERIVTISATGRPTVAKTFSESCT